MSDTITISDCYTGLINQIFTKKFQISFLGIYNQFKNERDVILAKRNLKDTSLLQYQNSWTETIKSYSLLQADQQEIVSVRELNANETNFCLNGRPVAAGILDLFTILYLSAKRKKAMIIYIQKCETSLESKWWEDLISSICIELKIDRALFKANFMFDAVDTLTSQKGIEIENSFHPVNVNLENPYSKVI